MLIGEETAGMRLSMYRGLVKAVWKGLIVNDIKRTLGLPASALSNLLTRVWLVSHYRRAREIYYDFDFFEMPPLISFLIEECSARVILEQDDWQSAA